MDIREGFFTRLLEAVKNSTYRTDNKNEALEKIEEIEKEVARMLDQEEFNRSDDA